MNDVVAVLGDGGLASVGDFVIVDGDETCKVRVQGILFKRDNVCSLDCVWWVSGQQYSGWVDTWRASRMPQ